MIWKVLEEELFERLPNKRHCFVPSFVALECYPNYFQSEKYDYVIKFCTEALDALLRCRGSTDVNLPSKRYLESVYIKSLRIDVDVRAFMDAVQLP